jgi:hypothetical protein
MILASVNILSGLYFFFSHAKSYPEILLNTAASVIVLGMGYLMYCFVKIIEKFKNRRELPN